MVKMQLWLNLKRPDWLMQMIGENPKITMGKKSRDETTADDSKKMKNKRLILHLSSPQMIHLLLK